MSSAVGIVLLCLLCVFVLVVYLLLLDCIPGTAKNYKKFFESSKFTYNKKVTLSNSSFDKVKHFTNCKGSYFLHIIKYNNITCCNAALDGCPFPLNFITRSCYSSSLIFYGTYVTVDLKSNIDGVCIFFNENGKFLLDYYKSTLIKHKYRENNVLLSQQAADYFKSDKLCDLLEQLSKISNQFYVFSVSGVLHIFLADIQPFPLGMCVYNEKRVKQIENATQKILQFVYVLEENID